jgi:hypothetical protein
MAEHVYDFDVSIMSGCLTGRVPQLTDVSTAISHKHPVKCLLLASKVPLYGTVVNLNELDGCVDIRLDPSEAVVHVPASRSLLFSAEPLQRDIPTSLGSTIIVGNELFTVVKSSDSGLTVWVGDMNLVYYGEDINSIIADKGGCITIS